jgi:hypothetical protein
MSAGKSMAATWMVSVIFTLKMPFAASRELPQLSKRCMNCWASMARAWNSCDAAAPPMSSTGSEISRSS